MGERISINTTRYQILQEPGMRPPSMRLTYASSVFQKQVVACFKGILPWLLFTEEGVPFFEHRDEAGRETCILSSKVASIDEIPRGEVLRMLEGWLSVQTLAVQPGLDPVLANMMATFMLPDPERDLRQYRLYDPIPPARGQRLHVLWGFTTKTNPRSAILAEYALCQLLRVPPEELAMVAHNECDPHIYRRWVSAVEMSA